MKLGIVGNEAAKFTLDTEIAARRTIRFYLDREKPEAVVSGHCHIGGVDIWAEEEADVAGIDKLIFAPRVLTWGAPGGFKERNLAIARASDLVLVVVVKRLPDTYKGMRFDECYHCARHRKHWENTVHVKSGACWTAWEAVKMGKKAEWVVV